MPENCIKLLDEIKNDLNLKFLGRAVDWMWPDNMNGLVEMAEEMGYASGGQTIDSLLKMGMETEWMIHFKQELDSQTAGQTVNFSVPKETRRLIELTRELGCNKGGEIVDCLLEMTMNPMLSLINAFVFKDGARTIEWLLIQAQPSIKAATMNGFNPAKQPETPAPNPPENKPHIHSNNFTGQPHQFHTTGQQFVENQQQAQFHIKLPAIQISKLGGACGCIPLHFSPRLFRMAPGKLSSLSFNISKYF